MIIDDVLQPDGSVWLADQVFPARVVDYRNPAIPRADVKTCLVQMTNDRWAFLVIGNALDNTGPAVLSIDEVTIKDTTSRARVVTVVDTQTEIHWSDDPGNCGCGSRVRGWTPFHGRIFGVPLPQVP